MMGLRAGRLLRWSVAVALFGWIGRAIALPRFWVFGTILLTAAFYVSARADPTLFRERLRPAGPTVDRGALLAIRLLGITASVVAIADISRFHWSDSVPEPVRFIAMIALALSMAVVAWAMVANRFFSSAIRIQTDRHHNLIRTGPYALVRHPGYLGFTIVLPAEALALGSWWALAFALGYSVLIARRASVEDRYLQEHLEGYADYASRVRYRFVPGLW